MYKDPGVSGMADDLEVFSGYDLNVAVSGASDNGITYSVGFDFGGGNTADWNDDYALDSQTNESDTKPAVTIGYAGATIVIDKDGVDDLYDDGNHGDIKLSTTLGGLSVALVAETDTNDSSNSTSFSVSGAASDLTWSLVSTNGDTLDNTASKVTVGYTVSDTLGLTFKHDTKSGAVDAVNTITAALAMGALTLTVSADDNNDNDLTVGYAAGPLSASYTTNEEDFWKLNGSYDLGGGAAAFVSMDDSEWTALGMSFAF